MTYRDGSKYEDHPRITWFGIGGTVNYTTATESWFIGGDERGGFKVIPPSWAADNSERTGFDTIDAGIDYALAETDR